MATMFVVVRAKCWSRRVGVGFPLLGLWLSLILRIFSGGWRR
jgi:hypothetical protein